MPDPTPTPTAATTPAASGTAKPGGVEGWWKGLGKEQQYALTGSLIGGGTFGALNMLRQGKRNRFKNFLSGLAVGGLGGAAAGYGGAKLMDPAKSKPQEKPGVPKGDAPAPTAVDNGNFVGVGGDKPPFERSGESFFSGKNLAEGGRQLGRSGLRVGTAAGIGAVGLPTVKAIGAYAGPDISRRWHNSNASSAGQRATVFGNSANAEAAKLKGLYARKVLAGPNAKQVQRDLLAKRNTIRSTVAHYRASEATAKAEQAAAAAKATAAAGRTPTPGAATRAAFKGRQNILGLGKLRNPVLGALMGGGYQAQREARNGADE